MKRNDLTGQRFGKLIAESCCYDREKKIMFWKCRCDCGKYCFVRAHMLVHKKTNSCGCLRKESNTQKKTTHGMSKTSIYGTWNAMKGRCYNGANHNYNRYGKRGIIVCDEWKNSFESFYEWAINNGYKKGLSLDRIDNNGNYCPTNCRWVSTNVQNNNRGVSINITYNGKTQNLAEWCKELNLPYIRIWQRLNVYGFTFEEAITEPTHKRSGKRKISTS